MQKSKLSLLSIVLALIMLLGVFASCAKYPIIPAESDKPDTPAETEGAQKETENEDSSDSSEGKTETEGNKESEGTDETKTPEDTKVPEEDFPSIEEIDNGLLIQNANALKNGVNAYFTDGKRTDFALVNQNMILEYALAAYKDQQVTSLKNHQGGTYIENTFDAFVKMNNGNKFYTSKSTKAATGNLYRMGYYMYESRFEEQNFAGDIVIEKSQDVDISSFIEKNQVKVKETDSGSQMITIGGTKDPFVKLKDINYSTADYQYVQITMKASTTKLASCAIYIWVEGQDPQSTYFSIYPDGEYHTYTVDLSRIEHYDGKVTGLRLDFENQVKQNDTFEISGIKLVGGNDGGVPKDLGINRSFFVYSNKLHHVLQIATDRVATEDIALAGLETKIAESTVAKLVVKDKNGLHDTLADVDWDSAEYVGFDIKDVGIFGYILPADGRGDKLEVTLADGYYTIIQSRVPENNTILPSAYYDEENKKYVSLEGLEKHNTNGNDFFMGQRIYTDESHDFAEFLHEAYIERNPLSEEHFIVSKNESTYSATFICPNCGFRSEENMLVCDSCKEEVTFVVDASTYYKGYDPLRGIYQFMVPCEGFNNPYFMYPNNYINLTFRITGDEYDRDIYLMSLGTQQGCIECAALLDENQMMLPVPIEVGKNFSEGTGERNLWNVEDPVYSEAIFPMVIKAGSKDKYTLLNLYQNWGKYPLKQVSWIQFYAPYYHLSTGVIETNCIVPYYACKNARSLGTLPDHRAMSAPFWAGQPQHNSGGSHRWLIYTDSNGVYSASEDERNIIDSYGPVYADVIMDYLSDDGNIRVTYTHTEFPQTDENRAYYEMHYQILGDVSFTDFAKDFCFYDLGDNDSTGSYINVGYLNEKNECVIVDAAKDSESFTYVLGDNCPYFSFFNMPDWNRESTSAEGYTNLSMMVYNSEFVIGGEKATPNFAIVNENNKVRLTLNLKDVQLKAGDEFTINCIVMPWGSQESVYDSEEFAGDQNVRDVRVNTLLNPLTPTAVENCEVMDSVFVPRVRTTNGKDATFTLTGGQNNVAVRVYGFKRLTVPKIQELVDGQWVDYQISSAYNPDKFGNAFYFDGYSVHYDEDQTFSYAFIVPMDYTDKDGRTFRVAADTEFEGWPRELPKVETEKEDLPLNIYFSADDLYSAMRRELGKAVEKVTLSGDGTFTSIFANGSVEAYFNPYTGDGGKTVTGQYVIIKYRIPTTNANKYSKIELFTSTKDLVKEGCSHTISQGFINDGKWHVVVADLSTWDSTKFLPDSQGDYRAQYLRLDIFNDHFPSGNSIDLAYVGMHHDLNEIFELNSDLNEIIVVTGKTTVTTYDSKGNVIATPSDEEVKAPTEGFDAYYNVPTIADKAVNSEGGHSGKTVISANGNYVSLYNDTDEERARTESYFYLFNNNTSVTGQYLVIRYRANKPCGIIQIYTSTENSAATSGDSFDLTSTNFMFQTDGEWHNAVVDISKLIPTYTSNGNGEYIAKYLRVDLFNFLKFSADEVYVDIAYIGLTSSYEDAISHAENSFFYDGSTAINATTGKPLDGSDTVVTPSTPSTSTYVQYFNATSIIKATQSPGTGHLGEEELMESGSYARIHLCTDASKSDAVRRESYFYLLKDNSATTGQYLVIKYRSPEQVGSMQVYTSTENSSASDDGGSTSITEAKQNFIGDNQWHILVIDLSKCIRTYTPSNGTYTAKHLRIDLFNFDKVPAEGTTAYVDLAYIGTTDDYTKILGADTSVENIIFHDGATSVIPNTAG